MDNALTFGTLLGVPPVVQPPAGTFRIAILSDFSGRANRGELDSADDIARRKPTKVDFDSLDEVLEAMSPRLRLPIAGGRSAVELEFSEVDDFGADRLLSEIPLLDEVQGIRRRIERSIDKAVTSIRDWSAATVPPADGRQLSRGTEIPPAQALEEFASLQGRATAADVEEEPDSGKLLEAICAPFLVGPASEKKPSQPRLLAAAAECLHAAMRMILHHPDFQALEGAWRELDWLLRRVDQESVQLVLFDLSAEEFAADLARADDLTETGLYRLLVEKMQEGSRPQPLTVVLGRYEFDYSPAHAALLGRMGKICERLNAPFLSSISLRLLQADFKLKDDDRLAAWNDMRALPSAAFLGLGLPAFLLRMPYGSKGRSTEKFEFEEVDRGNVRGSLLWGNPATFCTALLTGGYLKEAKWEFDPNTHRVLDKLPLYIGRDDDDEPLAIATEAQLSLSVAKTVGRLGLIPLLAVKDRDSVQVSQLRSLAAADARLRGAWLPGPVAETSAATSTGETAAGATPGRASPAATAASAESVDLGGLDPELAALLGDSPVEAAPSSSSSVELDPELAALLGDSGSSGSKTEGTDDDIDPELKALLGG
jgi:type VI secretion system protein ImpC